MPNQKKPVNWTNEKIFDLISLYQKNECLWNCNIDDYKHRNKRHDAVVEICKTLNITKEQFAKKIHNLRNQFNCEMKKVQKRNLDSDSLEYQTKWEYFEPLQFLSKVIAHRPGFGYMPIPIKLSKSEETTMNDQLINDENTSSIIILDKIPNYDENGRLEIKNDLTIGNKITYEEQEYETEIQQEETAAIIQSKNLQICSSESINPKKPRLEKKLDECEIFGEFVASELRGLSSEISRKKLKRKIMQAILEVGNEDDGININIKLN